MSTFVLYFFSMLFGIMLQRYMAGIMLSSPKLCFADMAIALLCTWLYWSALFISGRCYFAAYITTLAILTLWCADKAKRSVLAKEPLLFTDLAFLKQIFRTPGLYFPYLPWHYILLSAILLMALGVMTWKIGTPVPTSFLGGSLVFCCPFFLASLLKTKTCSNFVNILLCNLSLSFSASKDAAAYGTFGAFVLHYLWSRTCHFANASIPQGHLLPSPFVCWPAHVLKQKLEHPNIILIQSESFCDPRNLSLDIPADILTNYDALCHKGLSGRLKVQAVGAYTMRTEFSVLTGLSPATLGVDAFNPYLAAEKQKIWSLAWHLRRQGWHTVCVHPFLRTFFQRNQVMPNLGFEHFFALENLPHLASFGPHTADRALMDWITKRIRADAKPVFCFVITMENHGPWTHTRFNDEEVSVINKAIPPQEGSLWRWLAHLKNCDTMLASLSEETKKLSRPSILALYGDHQPILPLMQKQPDSSTPYFIWHSKKELNAEILDLSPEELGGHLLSLFS